MFMSVVTVHIRKCLIVRSQDVFVIVCCDREYQEVSHCAFIGDVTVCCGLAYHEQFDCAYTVQCMSVILCCDSAYQEVSDCVYTVHVSNCLL